jgi:hypothetical protein
VHTLGPDGHLIPSTARSGLIAVVPSIAAHIQAWASPEDLAMTGPRRGVRYPVPIWSTAELTLVVGKDGQELTAEDQDPDLGVVGAGRLVYGATRDRDLREQARAVGMRELARRTGITYETVRKWAAGGQTSPANLVRISQALGAELHAAPVARHLCALPGCTRAARPRSAWCSDAHNKAGRRRASLAQEDLTAGLPACPDCGVLFINPRAAELHCCKPATP